MPAQRLSMRKIKEVLRLRWANSLSKRKIARSCGVSRPAVDEYLRRAKDAGLSWPLPANLDDEALDRLLFPAAPNLPALERGLPDWSVVNSELKLKGVTLFLLWQEYREWQLCPGSGGSLHVERMAGINGIPTLARFMAVRLGTSTSMLAMGLKL